VNRTPLPGRQGAIVWALVLFENEQPFHATGRDGAERTYEDIRSLSEAVRKRDLSPEFTVRLGAKVRPVLLLQDRPQGRLPEFVALKLTRLEKMREEMREAIKAQRVERFFYIPEPAKFGLRGEFAVDLLALTRVHESAIASRPRAQVNANEFRVISERMVRVMDLDLSHLVAREAVALLKRQARRPPGF
jgi:hypothetical protein